jgi:hypothetical protein
MGKEKERTMESIESTIREMDEKYDANFGEWVRNEENLKIVSLNFKKYLDEYDEAVIVEVVKWVVRRWKLKSICALLKDLLVSDLFHEVNDLGREAEKGLQKELLEKRAEAMRRVERKMRIVKAVVGNWTSAHIAEFIALSIPGMTKEEKKVFLLALLREFSHQKLTELFVKIDSAIDWAMKISIIKSSKSSGPCRSPLEGENEDGSPLLNAE